MAPPHELHAPSRSEPHPHSARGAGHRPTAPTRTTLSPTATRAGAHLHEDPQRHHDEAWAYDAQAGSSARLILSAPFSFAYVNTNGAPPEPHLSAMVMSRRYGHSRLGRPRLQISPNKTTASGTPARFNYLYDSVATSRPGPAIRDAVRENAYDFPFYDAATSSTARHYLTTGTPATG